MPQDPTATTDVAVIGGGVIGLAIAWRAAARGLRVCVLERGELGAGASRVAAGMLAPVTEADAGEVALLGLGLRSARGWPDFAAELEQAAGADPGLRRRGALVVARDRDEAEALDRELALRLELGLDVQRRADLMGELEAVHHVSPVVGAPAPSFEPAGAKATRGAA